MMSQTERKRRARMRRRLHRNQQGRCCYCRRDLKRHTQDKDRPAALVPTFEHLKERSRGGGFTRDNIALACRPCNHERGAKKMNWLEFATFKAAQLGLE